MIESAFLSVVLIFFRLLPIFVVAPILAFRRVPTTIRVLLSLALAIIFANLQAHTPVPPDGYEALTMLLREFVLGMSLAFSFHAAIAAVQTMGQLIDMQVGFAAAAIFDPNTEQTTSPSGEILTLALVMAFFGLDFHHELLRAFAELLQFLPPGADYQWKSQWFSILGLHFVIGFIIASPVILVLWLTDIFLAFLSRSLPQAQMYFVGLPVKVGIGILALAWLTGHALQAFHGLFEESLENWGLMVQVP